MTVPSGAMNLSRVKSPMFPHDGAQTSHDFSPLDSYPLPPPPSPLILAEMNNPLSDSSEAVVTSETMRGQTINMSECFHELEGSSHPDAMLLTPTACVQNPHSEQGEAKDKRCWAPSKMRRRTVMTFLQEMHTSGLQMSTNDQDANLTPQTQEPQMNPTSASLETDRTVLHTADVGVTGNGSGKDGHTSLPSPSIASRYRPRRLDFTSDAHPLN
jgi:hypothetical protein